MSTKETQQFSLVVRRYRGRERVLFMSQDDHLALISYQQHAKEIRNGDVMLWHCELVNKVAATSGGYNRTRW